MPFQYPAIINPGQITDTEISATAAITLSKLASGNTIYADTRVKVGSFTRDTSTASGNQAVTGTGFTPVAIIFIPVIGSTVRTSWGFADASTQTSVFDISGDTAGTYGDGSQAIVIYTASGTSYEGNVTTFDSNGFTIAWTKTGSPTGTAAIKYLAFR